MNASTWNAYTTAQRVAVVTNSKDQRFAYVNGQLIGQTDLAGAKLDATTRLTAYSSSDVGAGSVTVQDGDTLKSIAQRVYGEESLWYVLADANAIDDDSQLVAGTELKAPQVTTHQNDANTFKPYDPNQVIGPTTPSLPYVAPPPKQHCNTLATILVIVVVVIVTVYTAGAAAGAMAPATGAAASGTAAAGTAAAGTAAAAGGAAAGGFGATMATGLSVLSGSAGLSLGASVAIGAAAGGAGALAGQAVGSALGVSSFSWRNVAVGAITGAVSAGLASELSGSSTFATTVNGATKLNTAGRVLQGLGNYGGSVVANTIVGRDANFSWSAVAQTAIGAYVSAKIGGQLPITKGGSPGGQFVNNFGGLFLDGAANATTARVFGGPKQDWGQIATDAFGNALANAAVQGAIEWQANRALAQQMHDTAWADGNPFNNGPSYSANAGAVITGVGSLTASGTLNSMLVGLPSVAEGGSQGAVERFKPLPPPSNPDDWSLDQWQDWNVQAADWSNFFSSHYPRYVSAFQPDATADQKANWYNQTVAATESLLDYYLASSDLNRSDLASSDQQNAFGAFLDERAGYVQRYMTDAQFLDWQAHDNWSAVKVASAGPGLGLATSAAALSPAIAAAEMLYGGVQSVRDLNNGHYIRGTVGLALSVVGARGLASEWRSVNSVRSALYNSNASVLNAGQPTSLNGAKALDRWAIDGDVADTTLSVEAQFQANSLRAADEAHALFEQGINDLSIPRNEKIPYNTQAGGFVDQFVRKSNLELRDDLGLDIGSVRINQRLYAPDGSYTIPDLYFPESGNIIDYSYQLKTLNTPQIQGFRSASPNGTITIVPPSTIRPIYVVGP